ncbi:DegT/DnrJ/EryC1/StrS family aminotransferase [Chromatium okenii]|uniref:DegT/DnrJ/EryC1/StrS aminotransferase family protein n=1 Tax=Chromatium okenii TaxID=61644 RepID=A0A2S7XQU8_9GAMM|nr:DegT/DnrJ/EryC1/StrS family aminotransferase [Chromatium okenii]MBV5311334.1 DegT/DnrJ/EryC1/StrS aminotransferase family protein [Chromatium okenii]PQJ96100.1 hypothetical protein CXB77_09790 [Chromatium okenii]
MRQISYDSSQFPKARVSALPVPSFNAFSFNPPPVALGILTLNHIVHVRSGRYAIALALKQAGIGCGDGVLLPAYHCLAMVEPLLLAGINPIYYPINADLSINLSEIEKRAAEVKAIIVVHYFGFPQDFRPIRNLADRLGLILIEDCAHACFGKVNDLAVGSLGDYAIASTMKFYPIGHGGVVASSRHPLVSLNLIDPPLKIEIKTAINLLEEANEYGRLGLLSGLFNVLIKTKNYLTQVKHHVSNFKSRQTESTSEKIPEYAMDLYLLDWKSSRVSQFLLQHTHTRKLVKTRQSYYRMFLDVLSNRNDCRPLFPILSIDVVPQVFPLYVNQSLLVFVKLKSQGVPIIRFGEFLDEKITNDFCSVSIDYSEHVLQFPCHQTLKVDEVQWIIEHLICALNEI